MSIFGKCLTLFLFPPFFFSLIFIRSCLPLKVTDDDGDGQRHDEGAADRTEGSNEFTQPGLRVDVSVPEQRLSFSLQVYTDFFYPCKLCYNHVIPTMVLIPCGHE